MVSSAVLVGLSVLGGLSFLASLSVVAAPGRPWDLRAVGEDEEPPEPPRAWPSVCVLVPARNERGCLPITLPALLGQDYPGDWRLLLIDDRSEDGTAEVARALAREAGVPGRLTVVSGAALPRGWVGKVWALEQGAARVVGASDRPQYLLLTDADIRHSPASLRRLVAESEAGRLSLNSRMARLRCVTRAERLLIPPFLFFFNLLYPMRRVNDPQSTVAAAAGGCVLVRRDVLERAGGFAAIRGEVIDDVNLARRIKGLGEPIRLAASRAGVESIRRYCSTAAVWRMVRRTAFVELRHSWVRLAAALTGLAAAFALPPLYLFGAVGLAVAGSVGALDVGEQWVPLAALALLSWASTAIAFRRTVRFFGLRSRWSLTLPLAAVLYGAMTLDSAIRHLVHAAGDSQAARAGAKSGPRASS